MEFLGSFWLPGFMPGQLLLLLALFFLSFTLGNHLLKKIGWVIGPLSQAILIWLAAFVILQYIISPPIPSSLFYTYIVPITGAIFVLVSSRNDTWKACLRPLFDTATGATPLHRAIRALICVTIPALALMVTYAIAKPAPYEQPIELRSLYPAPPRTIWVHGEQIKLQATRNPFRIDSSGVYLSRGDEEPFFQSNPFDPAASGYLRYVQEGGKIYFQNCVFCHGANLDGQGPFAFAFRPRPLNLLSSLRFNQETVALWRISKGGANAPREIFPWDSAMPPWEEHLAIPELWKVALFEYWHTEFSPPTWE